MAETKQTKSGNPLDALPTAKDLMKQIALREAEKASAAVKAQTAEEARELLLAGNGRRCRLGDRVHAEVQNVLDD